MTEWIRRAGIFLATAGLSLFAAAWAAHFAGARVNITRSVPIGLYWVTDRPAEKGSYVVFCPPRRALFEEAKNRGYLPAGPCPGIYGYLMKRVLGSAGDYVEISDEGVSVNGQHLPHSAPRLVDGAGRAHAEVVPSSFTLGQDHLLLMSDVSSRSFDARYFGPIEKSLVRATVSPVLTW